MNHILSPHQEKQVTVINQIEEQVKGSSLGFTTVAPVDNYESDSRISLTSVHLPSPDLKTKVRESIIQPLRQISPDFFYYPSDLLHMTIKNIRVASDPPTFSDEDEVKAQKVFAAALPNHKKFQVYFYRLLLFPNNLSLIGTTDPELDSIFSDLDARLISAGLQDDKKYLNSQFFFSNMTLARFNTQPSPEFLRKVSEISDSLRFEPYTVDSVKLITCTAVLTKRSIIDTWKLA